MTASFEQLTDDLTLDEQAALAGGDDVWFSTGLPERGIPRIKVSDGPVGVRGESHTTTTSASFPCGSALGATFDPALVERVAAALGDEAITKSVHVLLGPTVNLHRHPLGGRNFECYSEDPTLTAALAVAFVRGVQSRRVAACLKHFVANDSEIERLSISSEVDERTLREVYLRPFEAAVLDADLWTLMGSYNRLNGAFACENRWLLTDVLKRDWGFTGVVISDWYATHDTVRCANAGLDLEMPGPARHFRAPLAEAVRRGDVDADDVIDKARRMLRLADRVGAVAGAEAEETSIDDPDRWALAVEAATASMVLLRNEPVDGLAVLPLDPTSLRRVAVIGPNAELAMIQGGGSAKVTPHRVVTPVDGLRSRLGDTVEVTSEPGCTTGERPPVLDGRLASVDGLPGIRVEYRTEAGGPVIFANTIPRLDPVWYGKFSPKVDHERFHVTLSATVTAQRSGPHTFGVLGVGAVKLFFDGECLIDTADAPLGSGLFGMATKEMRATLDLVAGEPHDLVVDHPRTENQLAGLRVGVLGPVGDALERAVAAAAAADVAVVVVGTDEDWETEGRDRHTMSLPGGQDELVRRVAAANPRTVVVVNAGAAVDTPWADDVPALVLDWFPGMAGGEALARVLVGDDEPGGRLPVTVPFTIADAPCDISAANPPGQMRYTEGLLVGHRWYQTRGVTPRWWFGTGTGYTSFSWGTPTAPTTWRHGEPLAVSVPVTNTGGRAGHEVVQVFAGRPASSIERPAWVFAGSAKVVVAPDETVEAIVAVDTRVLRHWTEAGWAVEPGALELRAARSAGHDGDVAAVEVVD
jgi:beta-glucosidase